MAKINATDLERVVMAGMKLMYSKETRQFLINGLNQDAPVDDRLATEAAGIIKMLDEKSNGTMPREIIVPAAVALMMEMVRFMMESGIATPTGAEIKSAMQKLTMIILDQYGILAKMQGGQEQPQQQEQMPPQQEQAPPSAGGLISAQQGA